MGLNEDFEQVLRESSQSSIKTIDDGIKFLSIWNNKLSLLIGDIIGNCTEEISDENSIQKLFEAHQITIDVATKVAKLSEDILAISNSIDTLIQVDHSDGRNVVTNHDSFILRLNLSIDEMKMVKRLINSPDYFELKDILIGLENNFKRFYKVYMTCLDNADPMKILQRPDFYN